MKKYHLITTLLCLIVISLLPTSSVFSNTNSYNADIKAAFLNNGYKLTSMPDEFYEIKDVKERKEKFINIMLSVIEEVNLSLHEDERVPASIILAQSALETGWGQSRFLKEGNALFGEWTFIGKGIKPLNAEEGSNHKVRSFDTLHSSMKSYIGNINTSKHYREFRKMRSEGKSGLELAEGLKYYSEEGLDYIKKVKSMISYNNLSKYDTISVSSKKSWYEKIIDRI